MTPLRCIIGSTAAMGWLTLLTMPRVAQGRCCQRTQVMSLASNSASGSSRMQAVSRDVFSRVACCLWTARITFGDRLLSLVQPAWLKCLFHSFPPCQLDQIIHECYAALSASLLHRASCRSANNPRKRHVKMHAEKNKCCHPFILPHDTSLVVLVCSTHAFRGQRRHFSFFSQVDARPKSHLFLTPFERVEITRRYTTINIYTVVGTLTCLFHVPQTA